MEHEYVLYEVRKMIRYTKNIMTKNFNEISKLILFILFACVK